MPFIHGKLVTVGSRWHEVGSNVTVTKVDTKVKMITISYDGGTEVRLSYDCFFRICKKGKV